MKRPLRDSLHRSGKQGSHMVLLSNYPGSIGNTPNIGWFPEQSHIYSTKVIKSVSKTKRKHQWSINNGTVHILHSHFYRE